MRAHRHQPCITPPSLLGNGMHCAICGATAEKMLEAERNAVEALALVLRSLVRGEELSTEWQARAEHALRVAAGKVRR